MDKIAYNSLLKKIEELRKSELGSFWNEKKFINSILFHKMAVFASLSCLNHSNTTEMRRFLDFSKLEGEDYLKAVKWFEYRARMSLMIVDGVIKKNPKGVVTDENYQIFSEFMKNYKGELPPVFKNNKELELEDITLKLVSVRDEDDLINTPMRLGGRMVLNGYGSGRKK